MTTMNDSVILNSILDQVYEISKELKLLHKKVDLIEALLNKNESDNNTEDDDTTEEQVKNMQFALAAQNSDKKALSNEEIASQFNKAKEGLNSVNNKVDSIVETTIESQKSSVDEETQEKINDSINGISNMIGRMKSIESLEYDIEKHIGL